MSKENTNNNFDIFSNDFIADVSNCDDIELPKIEMYQVYLDGNWIADCRSYEEAETIANGNTMNGRVDIELKIIGMELTKKQLIELV